MSTSTTNSGVAEVVEATPVGEEGVGAASPPPLTSSSFALGDKQDRVLNVVSGDVNITSSPRPHRTST